RHTRSDRDWSSDVCSSDLIRTRGRANAIWGMDCKHGLGLAGIAILSGAIGGNMESARTMAAAAAALALTVGFGSPASATIDKVKIGRASCRERVEKTGYSG